jgi:2-keto-3-deoxy-L-rhamnonate aldolase RhmA
MADIINPARARLEAGEVSIGCGLRQARTVDIAKAMKTCGFDWLFIDLEHGAMSLDTAVQISVAALDAGIAPLARVPRAQYSMATRLLDGGALGIVMPHVDTADEAREVVDHLKYPPLGHRSVYGALPHFNFERQKPGEVTEKLNDATLLTVMLESPQAIGNADAIAQVPGVDVLLIGTGDLTTEMGIPGQALDDRVVAAYETTIAACTKHGKWVGMGGATAPEALRKYIGMGVRMILAGNDLSLLMEAAAARTKQVRSFLEA